MKQYIVKTGLALLGLILLSAGASTLLISKFGADVLSAFSAGVSDKTSLSFGTSLLCVNIVIGVFVCFFDRKLIGSGSLMNMVLVGYFIEFFQMVIIELTKTLNISIESLAFKIPLLIVGFLLYGLGIALYIGAKCGVGPYDAIAIIFSERTGIKFVYARVGSDTICLISAFLLGGPIGITTLVAALGLGPLITMWDKIFVSKMYEKIL